MGPLTGAHRQRIRVPGRWSARPRLARLCRFGRCSYLRYTGRGVTQWGARARTAQIDVRRFGIHTFAATCPAPTLLLPGIIGRCCFRLVQESFLIFLVVAPKKDCKNDRRSEHRPSKWSSDSTNTFSKYVSANSEHCRPDNSPCRIEDEKPQRRQPVCASQQCRKGTQQSDETSEEDNLPAVTSKEILSQLPLPFVEPDQISPSRKQ